MYCPMCGNELLEIQDLSPEREREEYACSNSKCCFDKDSPLYFHHPFGGMDSAPGDSWSLSWVK